MAKKKQKKNLLWQSIIISIPLTIILLLIVNTSLIKRIEFNFLDFRFNIRPQIKLDKNIAYIDFDDTSIELCGLWPWSRDRQVQLISTLTFYKKKSAAYDVFFSEKSNIFFYADKLKKILFNPENYYFNFESKNNNIDFSNILNSIQGKQLFTQTFNNSFKDYDNQFEKVLKESNSTYLASFMKLPGEVVALGGRKFLEKETEELKKEFNSDKKKAVPNVMKSFLSAPDNGVLYNSLYKAVDMVVPLNKFVLAAKGIGFAQIVKDLDSIVRLYPIMLYYDKKVQMALSFKMFCDINDISWNDIKIEPGRYLEIKKKNIKIPIDEHGQMLVNWAGKFNETFLHIPFRSIAYYYYFIKAKEFIRNKKITEENIDKILENLKIEFDDKKIVSEEELISLNRKIVLSKLFSENIELSKSDLVRKKFTEKEIDLVKSIILFSDYILKNNKLNQKINIKNIINKLNLKYKDIQHYQEVYNNLKFFSEDKRLKEVFPYYFSKGAYGIDNGKTRLISPLEIKNKMFLMGLTGLGTIDLNPMPFQKVCPMVALHTNALNTFVTKQFLHFPPKYYKLISVILLTLLFCYIYIKMNAFQGMLVMFLSEFIYLGVTYYLWVYNGRWLNWTSPVLAIFSSYAVTTLYNFIKELQERKKVRGIFSTMVSPSVLKIMEESPELFSLKGERKAATMYFSLVAGFGTITQTLAPDELSRVLKVYLTPLSDIILDYNGYIDKYEGPVIMADFGVPLTDENNPWRCAYSAIEQNMDVASFQFYAKTNFNADVSTLMGVNFGYVSAGNMGSEKKMQYTVMGDAVNVAARFMPANLIYNTNIITGGATYYRLKDYVELRHLDKLLLKGKTKPTDIFEIMGWKKDKYFELFKDKPIPDNVYTRWSNAPASKIFGYYYFWKTKNEEIDNSVVKEIYNFFEMSLPLNAKILELIKVRDFIDNLVFLKSLISEGNELIDKNKIDDSGLNQDYEYYEAKFKIIFELIDKTEKELNISINETNKKEVDKLLKQIDILKYKFKAFNSLLNTSDDLDELLKTAFINVKQNIVKNIQDNLEIKNEYREKRTLYRQQVKSFVDKLKLEPHEYHKAMSLVGDITEKQVKMRELYEKGVNFYWNRNWDAALENLNEAKKIMPDDGPVNEIINRCIAFKETPPADTWQGEFIQTKK